MLRVGGRKGEEGIHRPRYAVRKKELLMLLRRHTIVSIYLLSMANPFEGR